jgi:PAS domain S-box-containing protein
MNESLSFELAGSESNRTATVSALLLIADTVPSLISYIDANRRYRFVNRAYQVAFGRPRETFIGAHVRDVVRASYPHIESYLSAALLGERIQYELTIDLPARGKTVLDVLYAPDFAEDGGVRGIVVVARDITDRKARQAVQDRVVQLASLRSDILSVFGDAGLTLRECLQHCTDRLLGPLDAAFVRIWTLDETKQVLELQASSGMYRHIDGAHSRIAVGALKIGMIAQSLVPHFTNDVLHDDRISDHEWAAREGIRAFAGYPLALGPRVVGVVAFFSKNMIDPQSLQLLEVVADVLTQGIQRKRSEASLQRINEARRILADASGMLAESLEYETTLENVARVAIPQLGDWCAVDLLEEGGGLRRIALAHSNQELIRRARQLRQKYPLDMGKSYGAPEVIRGGSSVLLETVDDVLLESIPMSAEELQFARELQLRSYMCIPLRARGRVLGAISFATSTRNYDSSDLAFAEELAATIAMAIDNAMLYQSVIEASRLKDEFLAILSHELRTPLTSVYGWLSLLRAGSVSDARKEEALEVMDRNVRTQIRLIEQLLDLSRITSGTIQLDISRFDPVAAIEGAIELMRPAARAKVISISFYHRLEGEFLRADSIRFQQILWNLLSNSVKFTPPDGSIRVEASAEHNEFRIAVSDTGIGIDREFLPFVFDLFRQGDSSKTRSHGGLGVGLSLAKHLAEIHGGRIEAESPGRYKGSTFTLYLPKEAT